MHAPQTKQQILDRRQALDQAVIDSKARKNLADLQRVAREQAPQRRQLIADCEASAGHVYQAGSKTCMFCEAHVDAAARQVAHNLTQCLAPMRSVSSLAGANLEAPA